MKVKLSKRLAGIAKHVSEGVCVMDVGCDHAYLPIFLLQTKKVRFAIACDVAEGPLERAKEHIEAAGLKNSISLVRSDGLSAFDKAPCEELVIAGMGGRLIIKILSESMDAASGFDKIIISPQSDIGEVRAFLFENGFVITDEELMLEDGKYYPILCMRYGKSDDFNEDDDIRNMHFRYGKHLIEKKDRILFEFLSREEEKLSEILANIEKSGEYEQRCSELRYDLRLNRMALCEMGYR